MLTLPAALVAVAITGSGAGDTVLLDFYADWCGPCRSMNPTLQRLAASGNPVRQVNIDQYPDLARRFGISNIPCFVMIVNGKEAGRVVGPTSIGRLQQLCNLGRSAAPDPGTMLAKAAPINSGTNVPLVPVVYSTPKSKLASDEAMLAASVRLRVEDPQGHSCGSGTIIDARIGGEALVLTCGHLFRDSKGAGKIEVDVFGPAPCTHLSGRLVAYDLERDIGLVAFRPRGPVMVARVAPSGYAIREGDAVTSVGCSHGDDPTVQHSRVNRLDRFLDPVEQRGGNAAGTAHAPWNLQVAGQPVVGRSGGGLFSPDGLVIGVCNAAEPVDHEGLFAALGSIQAALDQQDLASIYKRPIASPGLVPSVDDGQSVLLAADPFSAKHKPSAQPQTPSQDSLAMVSATHSATTTETSPRAAIADTAAASGENAAMDKIRRHLHDGCEVVCIIRDHSNPQAKNEVVMLTRDRAEELLPRNSLSQPLNIPTSMEVPKRPKPILEWDKQLGWLHQGQMP
jgi:thiol-disulfide isomerase/thioredoxin